MEGKVRLVNTQQDAEKMSGRITSSKLKISGKRVSFCLASSFVIPRRFRDDFRHLEEASEECALELEK